MKDRYVVDTNVLIAGYAGSPNGLELDAEPKDPGERYKVWQWLNSFHNSESHFVLDEKNKIQEEYGNKLGFNDFGQQVLLDKLSQNHATYVPVTYDCHGHGILCHSLSSVVHDQADRKMVAAAMEIKLGHEESWIAFAADTDWHDWEDDLNNHYISLEPVIEAWSRKKWREKINR